MPPGKPPLYIENSKYMVYVVIKVKYKDYIRFENFLFFFFFGFSVTFFLILFDFKLYNIVLVLPNI